jgi:hypothetical protein
MGKKRTAQTTNESPWAAIIDRSTHAVRRRRMIGLCPWTLEGPFGKKNRPFYVTPAVVTPF